MFNSFEIKISFRGILVAVAIFVLLVNCRVMPNHTSDQILFTMEKTACMGSCPVYNLKVYQDGWAILEGVAHVAYLGNYQLKLSDKEIAGIKDAFEKHDFFSLDEKYYANFSDLPTTYLFYRQQDRSKKVMDYHGAPQNLKKLEDYLATFLNKKWKKIPN